MMSVSAARQEYTDAEAQAAMARMVQHHVAHGWGDDTAQPAGSSQDDEDSDSSVYVDASGGGPASGDARRCWPKLAIPVALILFGTSGSVCVPLWLM